MQTDRLPCWDGKTQMAWRFDDGGRAAAGYEGTARDCVVRTIAIATGRPYQEVYEAIGIEAERERPRRATGRRSSPRKGVKRMTYQRYLESLGWVWHPTMQIGSGCTVHLCEEDLPGGRLIVRVTRHLTAVIDRVVHDNHDPQRGGVVQENGTTRISRRCVYGFYAPPTAVPISARSPCYGGVV